VAYDDEVLATGPVAFWLPEAAAVVDRVGARDASYVGTPTHPAGLTGAGTSLNCSGTVFAERAHEDALKPPVGTIMAWVRPATVANHWPMGADPSGENRGDFSFRLRDDGAAGAYFQSGSTTHLQLTDPSYYEVGQVMCMLVTFNGSGFKVYLDGHEIGTNTAHTTGLAGNEASWAIGADRHPGETIFNGEIDRVAIWNRVLARNEIHFVSRTEPLEPSAIVWRPSWGHLPYSPSDADTVVVSSAKDLETALAVAPPGRNILVAPGTRPGETRTMAGGGSAGNPVIIRPQNGLGTVTFADPVWTFTGSHVVMERMHFTGAEIKLSGKDLRLTRNRFRRINKRTIQLQGFFIRIDHNDFSDMIDGPNRNAVFIASSSFLKNEVGKVLIDSNYFHAMLNAASNNATEPIALGTTSTAIGSPDRDFIIAHNLFHNHSQPRNQQQDISGEGEILGLKFPHLFIVDNTFTSVSMYISFRTTHSCKYWSNWHEGNSSPIVRINGDNHDVRGNHMVTRHMRVGSGNATTQQQIDALPTLTTFYAATSKGLFVGNTCAAGAQIRVGEFHTTPSKPAVNNVLEACDNVVLSPAGTHQTGTVQSSTTAHDFSPAVKLTADDVGMAAVDLLA
jgi:hypothetical protein